MDNCPLIHSDHLMDYSRLRPDKNNSSRLSALQQQRKSPRGPPDSSNRLSQSQLDNSNNSRDNNNENYSRISLFKALTRRRAINKNNGSKHKKLCEDWLNGNNEDPLLHGVTFRVKFLGSALMGSKAGRIDASEATRTVIHMVKAGKKSCRVAMTVSPSGVMMVDEASGEVISEISIYDIAHCSMDGTYPTIFSFIATNKNDTNECYCFACDKRKMAQKATLTIADAFQLAYDIWRNSSSSAKISSPPSPQLIPNNNSSSSSSSSWVHFDQCQPLDTQLVSKLDEEDDVVDDDDDEDLLICFH